MRSKLEVSFNSPQCGWMSIGFEDGTAEFHTTTAHAPYKGVLGDLMAILTELQKDGGRTERTLKWNRDPEEYDLRFIRDGENASIEIYEYPTAERIAAERTLVFSHTNTLDELTAAFARTFDQLYEDRDTDDFEFNWHQPFPYESYEEFKRAAA